MPSPLPVHPFLHHSFVSASVGVPRATHAFGLTVRSRQLKPPMYKATFDHSRKVPYSTFDQRKAKGSMCEWGAWISVVRSTKKACVRRIISLSLELFLALFLSPPVWLRLAVPPPTVQPASIYQKKLESRGSLSHVHVRGRYQLHKDIGYGRVRTENRCSIYLASFEATCE